MSTPSPVHQTTEVNRPRSSQLISVSWNDNSGTATPGGARLEFEVAECVETKTVTTTTTTKRSYPPLYVREPRSLDSLDAKEYPLATRPTPPELTRFTIDLDSFSESNAWSSFDDTHDSQFLENSQHSQPDYLSEKAQPPRRRAKSSESSAVKSEPGLDTPIRDESPRRSLRSINETGNRRSTRSSSMTGSPSYIVKKAPLFTSRPARSDSPRRTGARPYGRKEVKGKESERATRSMQPSSFLATPDNSGILAADADRASRLRPSRAGRAGDNADTTGTQSPIVFDNGSPTDSETHTAFSTTVATPPILEADTEPFADADESLQQATRTLPPRVLSNVGVLDASLPSPRLSPTLSATHPPSNVQDDDRDELEDHSFSRQLVRQELSWSSQSQTMEDTEPGQLVLSEDSYLRHNPPARSSVLETRSMLERFDAMPNEMKTFMMYQFLRRCTRKTLHMVADVVNPALKCDFLKQLPVELSLHVLSYLDHRDMCRAAQVSKQWRNIIDSNETGWKELFDRDGFVLSLGELQRAITQGWGWQDPVGPEGCEVDLSQRNRMISTETELIRSSRTDPPHRVRASKRKRTLASLPASERSKRRASNVQDTHRDDKVYPWPPLHKSEGPLSAASAAAASVPDPQIGIPSLRKLHLFKSLYRRHHMIRQSWTSGKVKPGHVAFTAHPRHVITCLQFDDDKIITGSDDTLINVYDTKTGKLLKKLDGHEGGVWALQYEGNVLVSGSTDRSVRVWDIEKGLCTQVFYGHTSTVRCLQILMPSDTGKIEDGKPVMMPPKPLIITGSRDNQLRVWRLPEPGSRRYIQTGPPANDSECPYFIRILSGHTSSVRSIAAHGDILVSGSYDSTVRVWRISTGESLHALHGHTQRVYSVVLDVKRNRCISGSMDSMVKIWDLDTGSCLHTLEGHSLLVGLLDLRDEKLVSAAADSTLRVWDPESGRCKSTLTAHTGAITCFQHDGRKVISGSEKTVKMWDVQSGECIQDLLTDLSGVWQVKFDERRCVAAVQRDSLTYVEILDFGAVRDGKPPEELGKRMLLNARDVQSLMEEGDV